MTDKLLQRTTYAIKADTDLLNQLGWYEHPIRCTGENGEKTITFVRGAQSARVPIQTTDPQIVGSPLFCRSDFGEDGAFTVVLPQESELPF